MANYKCTVRGALRRETESFMAVQKKNILPEYIIVKINGSQDVYLECRIHGQAPWTISLIVIGFTELSGNKYKLVHDKIAYSVSWLPCKKCRVHNSPDKTLKNDNVKILKDFSTVIVTERHTKKDNKVIIKEKQNFCPNILIGM